ncbi:MAG: four helix bundle protein [Bacteroidota bacterium]
MAQRHNFRNLKIWQLGFEIADKVYDLVENWPSNERYGLTSQSVRSAISVPTNVAEGSAKSSDRDFKRYLEIALGSSFELETHLLIAKKREYGQTKAIDQLFERLHEEQKMLGGFIDRLKSKINF